MVSAGLFEILKKEISGEVLSDRFSRGRYATDASVYQMMPQGVVVPKDINDVQVCLQAARDEGVSVVARGGGTSQCGQTVNDGIVLDYSKYINKVLSLDADNKRCVVEPGIVLDELNRYLKPHGLWFPVDVSTASRATIGGMTANNSCGQRSIYYGTMRDNVYSIDALLANGDSFRFDNNNNSLPVAQQKLASALLQIGTRESAEIEARFPKVQRRVGGYNIDALVPSDAAHNLAHVLVGSEGTLALSERIELKLSPLPQNKVLGVCHFPTFYQAMDAAQHLIELEPRAIELVDSTMIALARDIDIYKPAVERFVRGNPAALLLVEFAFDEQSDNIRALQLLTEKMSDLGFNWNGQGKSLGGVVEAVEADLQSAIAEVRTAGLNIMMSMKTAGKPVSFVEDCAVELKDLAEYTRELTEVFHRHGTEGTWYAHASVGCLHVRPVLNLKLEKDAATMRQIADEAFDLVLKYKGSHSGEHGDGISRSEFHEKMFGKRLVESFKEVKQLFDPNNVLNPGKITSAPAMNDRSLFRYQPEYKITDQSSQLDWKAWSGLSGAVEMCNNNGACRKLKGGLMCPSYRVTHDEKDTTRGRANTLRLAMSGQLGDEAMASDAMQQTMKLCVSCKGCKRECPTGVDMAKMKIEVLAARAALHGYSLSDRLIGNMPRYAPYAARLHRLINLRNKLPWLAAAMQKATGISSERSLPAWRADWFRTGGSAGEGTREVVLLADTFNTWFEPDNLRDAVKVLTAMDYKVHLVQSAAGKKLCCGRTWLSAGMVDKARKAALTMQEALLPYARRGVSIVGLEPSCLLTLRDEHLSLLPGKDAETISGCAKLIEEFISEHIDTHSHNLKLKSPAKKILLHGHCHQKAFNVMSSVKHTLSLLPDTEVTQVETSCCGMAGSFGYMQDTLAVSKKMASLDLTPAINNADKDTIVVADGTSCRHQIDALCNQNAVHVVSVIARSIQPNG